jgi:hypothetical protein
MVLSFEKVFEPPRSPRISRKNPKKDYLLDDPSALYVLAFFLASSAPWRFKMPY